MAIPSAKSILFTFMLSIFYESNVLCLIVIIYNIYFSIDNINIKNRDE